MSNKSLNMRELALGVLLEISGGEEYSHIALRNVLEKYQYLEKQERAFLTRLVEGTTEKRIWCDYVIEQFSSVKIRKMKPVIREILRMSAYQIGYMDSVPDSAVCNEAVKLARKKGFQQLGGFVNGVLRNLARHIREIKYPEMETQPALALSVRYSVPEWIVSIWIKRWGEERTERILSAFEERRPLNIRVNQERITGSELKERLEKRGIKVTEVDSLPGALGIEGYDYLAGLPEFQEGLFQVQDLSSMLAVEAAGVKKGDYCIDVCAAPGGKTVYMAEKAGADGYVDARDLTEYKAELIRENCRRLGLSNTDVSVKDACVKDEASVGKADVVLADLPCSGLGVIGKKTDIRYRMSREQQGELAKLQREILDTVQSYVKPGGTLLYSTCTINPEENEENAEWFLENYPFEAVSLEDCLPEKYAGETGAKGYVQLLPDVHGCDGFFIAKFRKKNG